MVHTPPLAFIEYASLWPLALGTEGKTVCFEWIALDQVPSSLPSQIELDFEVDPETYLASSLLNTLTKEHHNVIPDRFARIGKWRTQLTELQVRFATQAEPRATVDPVTQQPDGGHCVNFGSPQVCQMVIQVGREAQGMLMDIIQRGLFEFQSSEEPLSKMINTRQGNLLLALCKFETEIENLKNGLALSESDLLTRVHPNGQVRLTYIGDTLEGALADCLQLKNGYTVETRKKVGPILAQLFIALNLLMNQLGLFLKLSEGIVREVVSCINQLSSLGWVSFLDDLNKRAQLQQEDQRLLAQPDEEMADQLDEEMVG